MGLHSLPLASGPPAVPVNENGALRASLGPDAVVIDSMDSGLHVGWTGETADYSADNSVFYEGSGSAVTDTPASALDIRSKPGDGLPSYFPKGRAMRVYFRSSTATHPYHCYYAHADGSNEVDLLVHFGNEDIRWSTNHSSDGNNDQHNATFNAVAGDWYELFIERHDGTGDLADNDHRITLTNVTAGTQETQATFNWPFLTSEAGLRHWLNNADEPFNLDWQHHIPLP